MQIKIMKLSVKSAIYLSLVRLNPIYVYCSLWDRSWGSEHSPEQSLRH